MENDLQFLVNRWTSNAEVRQKNKELLITAFNKIPYATKQDALLHIGHLIELIKALDDIKRNFCQDSRNAINDVIKLEIRQIFQEYANVKLYHAKRRQHSLNCPIQSAGN